MKQALWRCLKTGIIVFIVLSTTLAVYIQWDGRGFDPIREIQRLRSQGHRDDALDVLRFLRENQLGDPDYPIVQQAVQAQPALKGQENLLI